MKMTCLHRLVLVIALLPTATVTLAQGNPPTGTVERLHATLLEAMRGGETLGFSGRYALLEPIVLELFDFESIARIVTGSTWKNLSEAQRAEFTDVFGQLSVATYASNFADFSGESFVTLETTEKRGATIVRTALEKADGERVSLNYMLRKNDNGWHIISVVAQGVSDLSLKRAEYGAVISDSGFDSLLNQIKEKVAQMRRQ